MGFAVSQASYSGLGAPGKLETAFEKADRSIQNILQLLHAA
jgi:hypothetical protein